MQQESQPVPPVAKALTHQPGQGQPGQAYINALATGRKPYLIPKSIPPRVRKAIELLVFDGLTRPEAAAAAGISDNWLYQKLKIPEVLKYYRVQSEVLRSGQRHKNLHKAMSLRDTSESGKVAIEAMKFLENDYSGERGSHQSVSVNVQVQPGYIVDMSRVAERSKQILQQGGPAIEHDADQ